MPSTACVTKSTQSRIFTSTPARLLPQAGVSKHKVGAFLLDTVSELVHRVLSLKLLSMPGVSRCVARALPQQRLPTLAHLAHGDDLFVLYFTSSSSLPSIRAGTLSPTFPSYHHLRHFRLSSLKILASLLVPSLLIQPLLPSVKPTLHPFRQRSLKHPSHRHR